MWRVQVVVSGRETGTYELVEGAEMVVGRDPTADIVVGERSVSRKHCRMIGSADGVDVLDLDSANGVYSGGRAVKKISITEGEEVQIGMAHLRVSKIPNRTGMIPIQGLMDTIVGHDDPSTSSVSDSTRSVLDASKTAYKALEKDRLALLIEAGKSLSQPVEVEELLERIMDHLFEILKVRRAVIVLQEDDGRLAPRCLRPQTEERELSDVASQSILRKVMESGTPQIIDDAQLDTGFNMAKSILAANIKAAICAPMTSQDRVIGALYADYPGRAQLYRRSDLDFFGAFASLSAVALDNARMQKELREREREKRDMQIAAEIQLGLLPDDNLDAPGFEMDWAYFPSKQIGGDFYDCTLVDDHKIALVLGDVSGKSVGAALFMARLVSFLRATMPENPAPGAVLTKTNALLGERSNSVMFATACYMVISREDLTLRYASAGHLPVLVLEQGTDEFVELGSTGIPLGVVAGYVYEGRDIPVAVGSLIVLYTDGITEARNQDGEQYGLDALKRRVLECRDQPVKEITRVLKDEATAWSQDASFTKDDIAVLVLRIEADAEKRG